MRIPARLFSLFAATSATLLAASSHAAPVSPQKYQDYARALMKDLIEINTTHEFGVDEAVNLVAARLRVAGFPESDIAIVGPRPKKMNLVVRLKGKGKAKPIVLVSHLDVVEARPEDWSFDPFKLIEQDGYFYGRGTLDIKDEAADLITNLVRLKEEKFVPSRDLIVALTADEEAGGDANGAKWLVENRRDLIDGEFLINTDAGGGQLLNGKPARNLVQTSEKIYATYQLEVTNPGGHSSLPPLHNNAIYQLAKPLVRLDQFAFPVELNDTTRAFFKRVAKEVEGQTREDALALLKNPADEAVAARLSATPLYNSTMRTTCVATMLQAGHAENALPQRAQATIQCRLLPQDDPQQVMATLTRVVNDPGVHVTAVRPVRAAQASPVADDIMGAVTRATEQIWPGTPVYPVMDVWGSDNTEYRAGGLRSYGVSGVFFDPDDVRSHGKDERVGVREFYEGVEFMYRLMKELGK